MNLADDPQQKNFADDMTEELIGELSRIGSLRVISRTSVMQYKGGPGTGKSVITLEVIGELMRQGLPA